MLVDRMRAEMSQAEFLYWTRYYARRHQDDELERLRSA